MRNVHRIPYRTSFVSFILCLLMGNIAVAHGTAGKHPTQYLSKQAQTCSAQMSWITSPSLPLQVTPANDNCAFHQFMWQSFLYLMQPIEKGSEIREFQTWMPSYGVFVEDGQAPTAWGDVPDMPYCKSTSQSGPSPDASHIFPALTKQAGSHQPLIDQELNYVYYSVSVNKPAYDFLTQCDLYKAQCGMSLAPDRVNSTDLPILNIPKKYPQLAFPVDSVELKISWKVLTAAEERSGLFYSTKGTVKSREGQCLNSVSLGLVGIHIVSKTPNHPEFIWATFEHKNNAPDCTNLNAPAPLGGDWTFYDKQCEGQGCGLNEYHPDKPAQVCRAHPWGDPLIGVFPGGLDCDSTPPPHFICDKNVGDNVIKPNTTHLQSINTSVAGMLHNLAKDDPNRLWANYELVGNIWTQGGFLPPVLQAQRGSLSAANTTMETFVQNGVAGITNPASCFSCHNQQGHTLSTPGNPSSERLTLPPAGLSHIFNLINSHSKGCSNGEALPQACAVYSTPKLTEKKS